MISSLYVARFIRSPLLRCWNILLKKSFFFSFLINKIYVHFFSYSKKKERKKNYERKKEKNKFKPERRKKERKTSLRVLNEIEEKTFLADRVSSWPWRGLHWLAIWSMVESNGGIEMRWMRVQKNEHGSKSRNQTNLSSSWRTKLSNVPGQSLYSKLNKYCSSSRHINLEPNTWYPRIFTFWLRTKANFIFQRSNSI